MTRFSSSFRFSSISSGSTTLLRVTKPLLDGLKERGWDYRILMLSDHKTLTSTRGHDGDPVPYLLYDSTVDTGLGLGYNERNAETGKYYPDGAATCMRLLFGL